MWGKLWEGSDGEACGSCVVAIAVFVREGVPCNTRHEDDARGNVDVGLLVLESASMATT